MFTQPLSDLMIDLDLTNKEVELPSSRVKEKVKDSGSSTYNNKAKVCSIFCTGRWFVELPG